MTESKYDVFVSYSHKNKQWVAKTLVPWLRAHYFRVITDQDFTSGSFSADQMGQAVLESRHVIAVFSSDYFESEWATLENIMAQQLDPAARKRKLLPILLEDCNIPLRLRVLVYRDLRADEPAQWQRLLRDLD